MAYEGKFYFMSRLRRFGKSLTVSTLRCLFQGKKDLFDGLCDLKLNFDEINKVTACKNSVTARQYLSSPIFALRLIKQTTYKKIHRRNHYI